MNRWNGPLKRYATSVARQTGRLLATLATNDDARMRIDWLLDTVFVSALDELEERGVPRRVAADMLGCSHRTLQRRYAAAKDAIEVVGRSTWTDVLAVLREGPKSREDISRRTGHVPPVIMASVLNDMIESGWVTERDGLLHLIVEPRTPMTDSELRRHVVIRRRSEPSVKPEDIARDLDADLARVRKAWDLSDSIELQASGFAVWIAMERCFTSTIDLLRESADNPGSPHRSATTWRVRLDDKPPQVQEKLEGFLREVRTSIEELVAPVKTRYDSDENTRFWSFTAYQSADPDESDY